MNGLQKAANISVIVAASIVSCAMLYRIFLPRQDLPATVSLIPELRGKVLPLRATNIGGHATALLLVRPGCHYCAASMPFYLRLASLRSSAPSDLKIVAGVGRPTGGSEAVRDYLAQYGIVPDALEPIDFETIGVKAVPTLIVLDAKSRVTGVWTGLLPAEKEKAVIAALRSRRE